MTSHVICVSLSDMEASLMDLSGGATRFACLKNGWDAMPLPQDFFLELYAAGAVAAATSNFVNMV
jgi:hypothetical protein